MTEPHEHERLIRIEEQVIGIRDDIADLKMITANAAKVMGEMHEKYVPRPEIEKMVTIRDKEKEDVDRQINAIWSKIDSLVAWRYWLAGAIALLGFILAIISANMNHIKII